MFVVNIADLITQLAFEDTVSTFQFTAMNSNDQSITAKLCRHIRPFVCPRCYQRYALYIKCSLLLRRFDYLLISHFLLNLQVISTVTSNSSNPSRLSFIRSDQTQVSSIRFANSIIGNLGAPLRDGPLEDDDSDRDNIDTEGTELSDLSKNNDEELVEQRAKW